MTGAVVYEVNERNLDEIAKEKEITKTEEVINSEPAKKTEQVKVKKGNLTR